MRAAVLHGPRDIRIETRALLTPGEGEAVVAGLVIPDTFRVEQKYLLERRHLLNRAMHGWGVVYGYPVAMAAADKNCPGAEQCQLEIGEGLALDKLGRELFQTEPIILTFDNVILLNNTLYGMTETGGQCGFGAIFALVPPP